MRYLLHLYLSYLKFVIIGSFLLVPFLAIYKVAGAPGVLGGLLVGVLLLVAMLVLEYFGEDRATVVKIVTPIFRLVKRNRSVPKGKKETDIPRPIEAGKGS